MSYEKEREITKSKKSKFSKIFLIFIILSSIFFLGFYAGNKNIHAAGSNITYDFENDYLYDGALPSGTSDFNTRSQQGITGNFLGTYSFENDTIPSNFEITENVNTSLSVVDYLNHDTVLQFYDNSPTERLTVLDEFNDEIESGTIEFWWSFNATETLANYLYFRLTDNVGSPAVILYFNYLYNHLGSIQYRPDGSNYEPIVIDNDVGEWYHVRIDFDMSLHQFEFYFNGVDYGTFHTFNDDTNPIANLQFLTRDTGSNGYYHYIDALSYSWDNITHNNLNLNYASSISTVVGSYKSGNVESTYYNDSLSYRVGSVFIGTRTCTIRIHFEQDWGLLGLYVFVVDAITNYSHPIDNIYVRYPDSTLITKSSSEYFLASFNNTMLSFTSDKYINVIAEDSANNFILCVKLVQLINTTRIIDRPYEIFDNFYPILDNYTAYEPINYDISYGYLIDGSLSDLKYKDNNNVTIGSQWDTSGDDYFASILFTFPSYTSMYLNLSAYTNNNTEHVYVYSDYLYIYRSDHAGYIDVENLYIGNRDHFYVIIKCDNDDFLSIDYLTVSNVIYGLQTDKYEFATNSSGDRITDINDIEGFTPTGSYLSLEEFGGDNLIKFKVPALAEGINNLTMSLSGYNDSNFIQINSSLKGQDNLGVITFAFYGSDTNVKYAIAFKSDLYAYIGSNFYYQVITIAESHLSDNYYSHPSDFTVLKQMGFNSFTYLTNFSLWLYSGSIRFSYNGSSYYSYSNSDDYDSIKIVFGGVNGDEMYLDNFGIYVDGDSLCSEINYASVDFDIVNLNVDAWERDYYNFVEITFNSMYGNNVSILVNDEYLLCNYSDIFGINYLKLNVYQEDSIFWNPYLTISNSSAYGIENIKIYGIKIVNDYDSEKVRMQLDSSNIDLNESYFYVSGTILYYTITFDDPNSEYMNANFNIPNMSLENYSMQFYSNYDGMASAYLTLDFSMGTDPTYEFNSYPSIKSSEVYREKILSSFQILITDNDDYSSGSGSGSLSFIILKYYPTTTIDILTTQLVESLIYFFIIIGLSFFLAFLFGENGRKFFVPILGIMTFVFYVGELIPIWLMGIMEIVVIFLFLIQRRNDSPNG